MAEPLEAGTPAGFSDRASLRLSLRGALERALPEIRIVAEGFLAEISPIDWLGVGAEGELVAVRIATPGGDPETLTRVLADLSWLRPRRLDLLKLAAGLGIDPSIEPRALLVAPTFGRETRAAVDNFPADMVQLWRSVPGQEDEQGTLRIERVDPAELPAPHETTRGPGSRPPLDTDRPPADRRRLPVAAAAPVPTIAGSPRPTAEPGLSPRPPRRLEPPDRGRPLTDPPSRSGFRTGLREVDLRPAPRPDLQGPPDPDWIRANSPSV